MEETKSRRTARGRKEEAKGEIVEEEMKRAYLFCESFNSVFRMFRV